MFNLMKKIGVLVLGSEDHSVKGNNKLGLVVVSQYMFLYDL